MFLVLSRIRHWFVLIFTVSYLFLFFITGLHSGGGLSAHVTDVTPSHFMCLSGDISKMNLLLAFNEH